MRTIYEGHHQEFGVWAQSESRSMPLPMRLDLRNHSPTGFAWGYWGSGPAQLALALCAHALGDDERALRVYQTFKQSVVGALPQGVDWTMSSDDIVRYVEELEAAKQDRDRRQAEERRPRGPASSIVNLSLSDIEARVVASLARKGEMVEELTERIYWGDHDAEA